MSKQFDWFDISDQDKEEWEELCPEGEYRIVKPDKLPSLLPEDLTNKYDSVFVMASGSNDGTTYYMANGNRVDYNAGEIDQMPLGLAFVGDSPIPSGSLIQHGDWTNRSVAPPEDFWNHVSASGIGNCYPISELPTNDSGSINDLNVESQQDAFEDLVSRLKKFTDNDD